MCKQFHSFGSAALGVFDRRCEYQAVFLTVSYMLLLFNDASISLTPRSTGSVALLSLSRIINLFMSLGVFNPKADLDTLYVTQA